MNVEQTTRMEILGSGGIWRIQVFLCWTRRWSQSGKWVWNWGLVVMDLEVELDVGLEVYPIDIVNDVTWVFSWFKCIQPFPKTHLLCIHFYFLSHEILLENFAAYLVDFGGWHVRNHAPSCYSWTNLILAFTSSSHRNCSAAILSTSDGGSYLTVPFLDLHMW